MATWKCVLHDYCPCKLSILRVATRSVRPRQGRTSRRSTDRYEHISHCGCVSPYVTLGARSGRTIGAEQIFPARLVQKSPSGPTRLPALPCVDRNFSPIVRLYRHFSPIVPVWIDTSPRSSLFVPTLSPIVPRLTTTIICDNNM